jgi:alanyl-tRNA synthetase
VIADHLRTSSFLIADGVTPSNEGRGYVLRRIMRRAMRHAHMLGARRAADAPLAPTLVAEMGEAYPELAPRRAVPSSTRHARTRSGFRRTLGRGMGLLDKATADV